LGSPGRRVKTESPQPQVTAETKTEKAKSLEEKPYERKPLQDSDWQSLAPTGEEFSVLMPPLSDAYRGMRYMSLGYEGQTVKVHIYRALTDQALFVIQSYEASNLKNLLRDIIRPNRELSFERDVKLSGFKGKSFTRVGLTTFGKGQYFITKKHLYIIEAVRRDGDDPVLDKFLNSVNLGDFNPATTLNVQPPTRPEVVVKSKDLTRKAAILWKPIPTFDEASRRREESGRISVIALLSANGNVGEVELRSGLGFGLNAQAIETANEIIFLPAEKDGRYVSQRVMVEYEFQIF
jgi:hypothetical protein